MCAAVRPAQTTARSLARLGCSAQQRYNRRVQKNTKLKLSALLLLLRELLLLLLHRHVHSFVSRPRPRTKGKAPRTCWRPLRLLLQLRFNAALSAGQDVEALISSSTCLSTVQLSLSRDCTSTRPSGSPSKLLSSVSLAVYC